MITLNFFHICFFTCFFFLGGLWTIFMIILTHNLFAEAHNSWLTFGHSFWHFVVDDFVVRRRRRSHADQWIKTNKFSSNFQVEIQTEINLFSNLFPSKFQYKKSSPTSQKHFCSEETHMEKCQRYHTWGSIPVLPLIFIAELKIPLVKTFFCLSRQKVDMRGHWFSSRSMT